MRQYRNTRYRKAKADDSSKTFPESRFTGKPYTVTTIGKVHLQFYDKELKQWRFICGKREVVGVFQEKRWATVPDSTPITCLRCHKHAPEIVTIFDQDVKEEWDSIPDIMDFQ